MSDQNWWLLAGVLLFTGAFLTGMGAQTIIDNQKIRSEYRDSSLRWKQELVQGEAEAAVRDMRNQELIENIGYVSMEQQIFLESGTSKAYVGISNKKENMFHCTLTLIRDATGELLYESGLLEAGYYIETISFTGNLKKGYYPCTAVWNFYTEEEEYAGEMAWKIVVVVKN